MDTHPSLETDDQRPFKLRKDLLGSAVPVHVAASPPGAAPGHACSSNEGFVLTESESFPPVGSLVDGGCPGAQSPCRQHASAVLSKTGEAEEMLNLEEGASGGGQGGVKFECGGIEMDSEQCTDPSDRVVCSPLGSSVVETADKRATVRAAYFKTSLCSHYRVDQNCKYGESCRFAHAEEELRPRPDGSWDPTSEKGKRLYNLSEKKEGEQVDDELSVDDSDTHLSYKCIVHVPISWGLGAFTKFLTKQGVKFAQARKKKRFGVGFIGFENEEQIALAKQILDGKCISSKILKFEDVLPRAWKKTLSAQSEKSEMDSAETLDGVTEGNKDICDAVTPLAKFPYEEQLQKKKDEITVVLKKLGRSVRKALSRLAAFPDWIIDSRDRSGLPCEFLGIVASPLIDGYRNKCEFTVGCSSDGRRVVGFQLGAFREGITEVEEPTSCRNVSTIARLYATVFQDFIQKSELPVWNKSTNKGFWRLLTVREGRAAHTSGASEGGKSIIAEVMLIVQVCSAAVEEDLRTKEYEMMAQALAIAASSACPPVPLSALLVQDYQGLSNAASPTSPLLPLSVPEVCKGKIVDGKYKAPASFIHEHMCNLCFRLSATAFFQVNTLAAEELYRIVGVWSSLMHDTLVFDVCCGTGTIGLTLASQAGMVIGIEVNSSAVADARRNAEINGITNSLFVCAKAEDVIGELLEKYLIHEGEQRTNVSAIKDGMLALATQEQEVNDTGDVIAFNICENGTHTAEFDKAESKHNVEEMRKGRFSNVVVIVDPPRSGLHPAVVRVLRACKQLHRIVYVSCNPATLVANAVELCTPTVDLKEKKQATNSTWHWKNTSVVGQARQRTKSMPASEPFKPVKAIAVDLFPHTTHCEIVMLMER